MTHRAVIRATPVNPASHVIPAPHVTRAPYVIPAPHVIPAKAGIQCFHRGLVKPEALDSRLRGNDGATQ
jgi:hypothetical protein